MAEIESKQYKLEQGELVIESARLSEAEQILEYVKNVQAETEFLIREPDELTLDIPAEERFIKAKLLNPREIFITAKLNGVVTGTLGFTSSDFRRFSHRGEFGISVSKKYWNLGIGGLLLDALIEWADRSGIVKISLTVDFNNEKAIRLYNKKGFKQEGYLAKDKRMQDGRYIDSIVMARIL